jgi:two-component system, NarL family, nitrate/nitrite response regulator NarL
MSMIKIIVIDDHLMFGEGIASMLNVVQIETIHIYTKGYEAEAWLTVQKPDVVLLDVNLQEEDGVVLCQKWLKQWPDLKIIGLSMHHEYRHVSGMYRAGAKGYLLKSSSRNEIVKAIRVVAEGGQYYRGEIETILSSGMQEQTEVDLNPKEKRILLQVVAGRTSRQIAESLGVSIKTVEFYRNSLLVKFNVKNSIELTNKARELLFV